MDFTFYNYYNYKLDLKKKKVYFKLFVPNIKYFFLLINPVVTKWSERNYKFTLQTGLSTFPISCYNTKWHTYLSTTFFLRKEIQRVYKGTAGEAQTYKNLETVCFNCLLWQAVTSNMEDAFSLPFTSLLMTIYQLTSRVLYSSRLLTMYCFAWARK